jgi:hypothetical protein
MGKDLRPLVIRNATNGISLASAHRDEIYAWFEELGRADDVELLLVKSPPFSPTVWVAVEAWLPVDSYGVTRRTRLEITISPRDFCRWPLELEVILREASRSRVYLGVVDFTRDNATALLKYLLGQTNIAMFGFTRCRVRPSLLSKAQNATVGYHPGIGTRMRRMLLSPLQIWRPRNRPVALKPDVLGAMFKVLLAFAALLYLESLLAEERMFNGSFEILLFHVVGSIVIVCASLYLLEISVPKAWQMISGGRVLYGAPGAAPGAAPAIAPVDAAAGRDVQGTVALTIIFVVALLALYALGFINGYRTFLVLAAIAWWLMRSRSRLVWNGGRPAAEPRDVLRMDSWQTLLIDLGPERDAVHHAVSDELKASGDSNWIVTDERIWHWGVDGKEERQQTVVSFRSALAFLHFYEYGNDLYVAWDAHINRGVWTEKRMGRGTSATTGALCEVHTIASAQRAANEYDVSDGNCVIERVHAVITRVLKRKLAEHKLDQEIDFAIVRERRERLTREDDDKRRDRPLLSMLGFKRQG